MAARSSAIWQSTAEGVSVVGVGVSAVISAVDIEVTGEDFGEGE